MHADATNAVNPRKSANENSPTSREIRVPSGVVWGQQSSGQWLLAPRPAASQWSGSCFAAYQVQSLGNY